MKRHILKNVHYFTAVVSILVAFSSNAYAGSADLAQLTAEKLKASKIKISVTTEAGSVTLEPGRYEVKPMQSPTGVVIRFTRFTYNPMHSFVYDREERASTFVETELVGDAKVNIRPLGYHAVRSELILSSDGSKAIGLRIRGSGFVYLFDR